MPFDEVTCSSCSKAIFVIEVWLDCYSNCWFDVDIGLDEYEREHRQFVYENVLIRNNKYKMDTRKKE